MKNNYIYIEGKVFSGNPFIKNRIANQELLSRRLHINIPLNFYDELICSIDNNTRRFKRALNALIEYSLNQEDNDSEKIYSEAKKVSLLPSAEKKAYAFSLPLRLEKQINEMFNVQYNLSNIVVALMICGMDDLKSKCCEITITDKEGL